jgi:acyl-CoA thioester hydrolase
MYTSKVQIRVRYSETDKMSYVYYGNYAQYFEVARVEALRNLGLSYKAMEEEGIMLPVLEYSVKFLKPAFYDQELTIETSITKLPSARINFHYNTFNEANELLNSAETTLVFVKASTGKPIVAPKHILEKLMPYFS